MYLNHFHQRTQQFHALLVCFLLTFLNIALSQEGSAASFQAGQNVDSRLVSNWESRTGNTFYAAVELSIADGWHTYWKNPGTTGMPTEIQWNLPEGMEIVASFQSIPIRYSYEGLVDYIHEDSALFVVEIQVSPDLSSAMSYPTISAMVEWLECETVCMPGGSRLDLILDDQAKFPTNMETRIRDLVSNYQAVHSGFYRLRGDKVELELTLEMDPELASEAITFFSDVPLIEAAAEQLVQYTEGKLTILAAKSAYDTGHVGGLSGWLTVTNEAGPTQAWRFSLEHDTITSPAGSTAAATVQSNLLLLIGLAFLGGVILNLMPCVFPVIGLKIMGFVEQAGQERKKIVLHGLIFTAGVVVSFWVLSAALLLLRAGGEQLGWGFQLQEPWFNYALILLMLAFALSLSGVFEVGMSAVGVGSELQHKSGTMGSFFSGVLATVVATPCSAPFLAPALGAALALEAWQAMLLFTFIALGLSTPYLLLSLFPSVIRILPRPGAWMETFKQFMAFPLYATAAYLLWALLGQIDDTNQLNLLLSLTLFAMAFWIYGRWAAPHRKTRVRRTAITIGLALIISSILLGQPKAKREFWEPWSPERVEQYVSEGRTVYVDFTARWCATCQLNKRIVFGSNEVVQYFEKNDVVALKADWTNRDPRITERLSALGKAAVPVNLVYKNGENEPFILPEILTPDIVLDALRSDQK